MGSVSNVYRDGKVHVMSKKCSTCIYRPGNLMNLREGRREQMEADAIADHGQITCHKTLGTDTNAVCRGFFDVAKKHTMLEAAERLGIIEYQDEAKDDKP